MKEKINKIIWISEKCGYGKTEDDALTTYRRIYGNETFRPKTPPIKETRTIKPKVQEIII